MAEELIKRGETVCWIGSNMVSRDSWSLKTNTDPLPGGSRTAANTDSSDHRSDTTWHFTDSGAHPDDAPQTIGMRWLWWLSAGPGGIVAKIMKVPVVIHEQNAVAGMMNYLAKFASKVLTVFPNVIQGGESW